MKATKLLLAAALFTGLAALSYAGPSQQFTTEQAQNRKEQQIKADAKAQPAAVTPVAVCAGCSCAAMKKA
jgi:hypothetical protein